MCVLRLFPDIPVIKRVKSSRGSRKGKVIWWDLQTGRQAAGVVQEAEGRSHEAQMGGRKEPQNSN